MPDAEYGGGSFNSGYGTGGTSSSSSSDNETHEVGSYNSGYGSASSSSSDDSTHEVGSYNSGYGSASPGNSYGGMGSEGMAQGGGMETGGFGGLGGGTSGSIGSQGDFGGMSPIGGSFGADDPVGGGPEPRAMGVSGPSSGGFTNDVGMGIAGLGGGNFSMPAASTMSGGIAGIMGAMNGVGYGDAPAINSFGPRTDPLGAWNNAAPDMTSLPGMNAYSFPKTQDRVPMDAANEDIFAGANSGFAEFGDNFPDAGYYGDIGSYPGSNAPASLVGANSTMASATDPGYYGDIPGYPGSNPVGSVTGANSPLADDEYAQQAWGQAVNSTYNTAIDALKNWYNSPNGDLTNMAQSVANTVVGPAATGIQAAYNAWKNAPSIGAPPDLPAPLTREEAGLPPTGKQIHDQIPSGFKAPANGLRTPASITTGPGRTDAVKQDNTWTNDVQDEEVPTDMNGYSFPSFSPPKNVTDLAVLNSINAAYDQQVPGDATTEYLGADGKWHVPPSSQPGDSYYGDFGQPEDNAPVDDIQTPNDVPNQSDIVGPGSDYETPVDTPTNTPAGNGGWWDKLSPGPLGNPMGQGEGGHVRPLPKPKKDKPGKDDGDGGDGTDDGGDGTGHHGHGQGWRDRFYYDYKSDPRIEVPTYQPYLRRGIGRYLR